MANARRSVGDRRSKLTPEQRAHMTKLFYDGKTSDAEISRMMGITRERVRQLRLTSGAGLYYKSVIEKCRVEKGILQSDFAKTLGLSISDIGKLQNGRLVATTAEREHICSILGQPDSVLFTPEGIAKPVTMRGI